MSWPHCTPVIAATELLLLTHLAEADLQLTVSILFHFSSVLVTIDCSHLSFSGLLLSFLHLFLTLWLSTLWVFYRPLFMLIIDNDVFPVLSLIFSLFILPPLITSMNAIILNIAMTLRFAFLLPWVDAFFLQLPMLGHLASIINPCFLSIVLFWFSSYL